MKALVLETGPKYTVVLTRQGEYLRVKTLPHYRVGCEIECPAAPGVTPWIRLVAVAAVLLLFISAGGFALAFATPYSYVNIDINPSVEMAANRFDYIIDVKSFDDDGGAIVSKEALLYKPLPEGVGIVLERLSQAGYLPAGSQSTLVLTFVSGDQKKIHRFDRVVGETVNQKLQDQSQVEVYVLHTDLQTHTAAEKYNLSPGRLLLIQELQKATQQDLNPSAMKDVPIGEIVRMVKEKHHGSGGEGRGINRQGRLKQVRPEMQQGQEVQDVRQYIRPLQEGENQRQWQEGQEGRPEPEREDDKEVRQGKGRIQVPERRDERPGGEGAENRERQDRRGHELKQERQEKRSEEEREEGRQSREHKNRREVPEEPEGREKGERPESRRGQVQEDHGRGQERQGRRQEQERRDSGSRQAPGETRFFRDATGKIL